MGDEAVDGSKMGTKLIMFVAIIGLALVAFLVGKALVNTGVDNLEGASRNINDSRFSDYNNKVVKGRAVKSAIDNFANEEVIILVHTLTEGDFSSNGSATVDTFASKVNKTRSADDQELNKETDGSSTNDSGSLQRCIQIKGITADNNSGIGKDANPCFVNYNAVANNKDGAISVNKKNGGYVYDEDFVTDKNTSSVLYNLQTRYISKKGAAEYIADGSSFDASLIKNKSNEIVGIVFSQKNVN